eukprot:jgi/Chrzof1/5119/Cz15g12050.t1
MESYARQAMTACGLNPDNLTVLRGVAEELPVDDNSQDVVVSTLVLCSVVDMAQVMSEVLRVLKPGGKFLFMEHVAGAPGTFTRRAQDFWNPAQVVIGDGCNCNRETWSFIEKAGFSSVNLQHFVATSNPLALVIAPHIAGCAIK